MTPLGLDQPAASRPRTRSKSGQLERRRKELVREGYAAFNNGRIDLAASLLGTGVVWPNEVDGGCERGREAVVGYWRRLFGTLRPTFAVRQLEVGRGRTIRALLHQEVRDPRGKLLAHQAVQHVFTFQGLEITEMESREPDSGTR